MGGHRTALLRQAHHIERRNAPAVQMRGHAKHGGKRDDPGTADSSEDHIIGSVDFGCDGIRQAFNALDGDLWPDQSAALDGDEAWAEAVDAGEILVAGTLI